MRQRKEVTLLEASSNAEADAEAESPSLGAALREGRRQRRLTQDQMGSVLGISRKVYHLFEAGHWLPPPRERAHFIVCLYKLFPPAARALAERLRVDLHFYSLTLDAGAPGTVALDPRQAKLVVDGAVLATAEELELSAKVVRPVALGVLTKLAESGIPLAQAVAIAAVSGKSTAT